MKKNIGFLLPSMNSGGAERVVSRLSCILSDEYNVYIILFEDTYIKYKFCGTMVNMDIKAQPNKKYARLFLPIKRGKKLREIKKNLNLDTVISFMDSPNLVNIISRIYNCKTILSIRNFNHKNQNWLIKMIMKTLYSKADCIISVSNVITEKMIKEYGIGTNKAVTIYNPYDTNQINEYAKEELDKEYQDFFNSGDIFISVGRHVYQKGFWHLVKAFKLVHDENPSAKLVIIGRDESDGKAEQLAKNLGIADSVLFIGYQENPFKYIRRSSVYVLSSLFEGFPNAMVEAMACGCPVIATDCKSGPREILYETTNLDNVCTEVEKADYGILVPPLDPEENWDPLVVHQTETELAKAMLMYLREDALKNSYSTKALERVEKYSYKASKQKFKVIIES